MTSPKTQRTICEQWKLACSGCYGRLRTVAVGLLFTIAPVGAVAQSGESESPTYGMTGSATLSSGSQSVYSGSVPEGQATGTVLPISFKEAIDRALRNNLGLLIGSDNLLAAKGQRWQELSHLLPNISAAATQS